MPIEQDRRWCIFTSAGDKHAIYSWLDGATHRRWNLVTAYYGDNDLEFSKIRKLSSYAFKTKGSKFQNLKKLVEENPRYFEQYSQELHTGLCQQKENEPGNLAENCCQMAVLPPRSLRHEARSLRGQF